MLNLQEAVKLEYKKTFDRFLVNIQQEDINFLKSKWQYTDLKPRGKDISKMSLEELRAYLIKRKEAREKRRLNNELGEIVRIWNASELKSCTISVEWCKSRMWGMNPRAIAESVTTGHSGYSSSGSIGGCGYDKLSTAVADAINPMDEVLKPLYQLRDTDVNTPLRELLGYGSGHDVLPYLEGGVGVSCYPRIFEKVGYKFSTVASGRTYDVFKIEKL